MKVACLATPADACPFRTAIHDDNPVMFFEHKALYATKGEVPDDPEFAIPFGKANIAREGTDATIVTNLLYVSRVLEAVEELAAEGISCEVIDPRTLVPLDIDTIVASVKKTGRSSPFTRRTETMGFGTEVVAAVTNKRSAIWMRRPKGWVRRCARCRSTWTGERGDAQQGRHQGGGQKNASRRSEIWRRRL